MGCSELVNRQIVESYGYGDFAQSVYDLTLEVLVGGVEMFQKKYTYWKAV